MIQRDAGLALLRPARATDCGKLLFSTRPGAQTGAEIDLATLELAPDEGVI